MALLISKKRIKVFWRKKVTMVMLISWQMIKLQAHRSHKLTTLKNNIILQLQKPFKPTYSTENYNRDPLPPKILQGQLILMTKTKTMRQIQRKTKKTLGKKMKMIQKSKRMTKMSRQLTALSCLCHLWSWPCLSRFLSTFVSCATRQRASANICWPRRYARGSCMVKRPRTTMCRRTRPCHQSPSIA